MDKLKIAVIGSGISGLAITHCLKDKFDVKIFEKDSKPGGLIKCENIEGNIYHVVGGHVFNSKNREILDWFWNFFNQEKDFIQAKRNAKISFPLKSNQFKTVGYPIENHIYQLEEDEIKNCIADFQIMLMQKEKKVKNFEDFLRTKFGQTLYELYFKPYNKKIWKLDLADVPLSWLEGKLPMPSIEEILYNNFKREEETKMVHSSFFYAKENGSQFIADEMSKGLNIHKNVDIKSIQSKGEKWVINESDSFDKVIFTGNVKHLPRLLANDQEYNFPLEHEITKLKSHGTTTVLCNIDKNPYSWVYLPEKSQAAHRIICTGNFSPNNNGSDKLTATIEFTDFVDEEEIMTQLKKLPFNPKYITHRYTKYTYPIQDNSTRSLINKLKKILEPQNLFLIGRFAEWEYYNMDAAIGAAIQLSKKIKQ